MRILSVLVAMFFASAAYAQDENAPVYECLNGMDATTTWGECLGVAFAPCAAPEFGSEEHAQCFGQLYEGWFAGFEGIVADTFEVLPDPSRHELKNILESWYTFAGQKCEAIGAEHSEHAAESAELGCQISEIVLLTHEFLRCQAGNSTETYCVGVEK